jgi:hypothetical protein
MHACPRMYADTQPVHQFSSKPFCDQGEARASRGQDQGPHEEAAAGVVGASPSLPQTGQPRSGFRFHAATLSLPGSACGAKEVERGCGGQQAKREELFHLVDGMSEKFCGLFMATHKLGSLTHSDPACWWFRSSE